MSEWLKPLIQRAFLEILDYDYQVRTEMNQRNRELPCCVMSYLKKGEALLRVDGAEYYCTAGDAIFVPPRNFSGGILISELPIIWMF